MAIDMHVKICALSKILFIQMSLFRIFYVELSSEGWLSFNIAIISPLLWVSVTLVLNSVLSFLLLMKPREHCYSIKYMLHYERKMVGH